MTGQRPKKRYVPEFVGVGHDSRVERDVSGSLPNLGFAAIESTSFAYPCRFLRQMSPKPSW